MDEASKTMLEGVTAIITSLGDVSTFVWGLFSDFLSMIISNAVIAFPVLLAILSAAILIVVKIVRRFGVRGKR